MANQKQRRRRAKEHRHDYDLVYVDEEGNEVPVETEQAAKPPARAKSAGKVNRTKGVAARGRGRAVQPPSWPRVLKRGAIFAPIFLITVMLLGGSRVTLPAAIVQTALLIAVFLPFSYFMDRLVWRQYQKRLARDG